MTGEERKKLLDILDAAEEAAIEGLRDHDASGVEHLVYRLAGRMRAAIRALEGESCDEQSDESS
jgi:hypothetical protein